MGTQLRAGGRRFDPVLWPLDTGRLHRRIPTADPNPITVENAGQWRPGSRRFSAVLAALSLAAAAVLFLLAPEPWSAPLGFLAVALAAVCIWRMTRGPLVISWVFAVDGIGHRRRDGMVAWVAAERVERFEAKVIPAGRHRTLVVRVRDAKKHVVLSAKPSGFDAAELLQAAAAKGYTVTGVDQ